MRPLPEYKIKRIRELRSKGTTQRETADLLSVSIDSVIKYDPIKQNKRGRPFEVDRYGKGIYS